jgi:hypothetical protein
MLLSTHPCTSRINPVPDERVLSTYYISFNRTHIICNAGPSNTGIKEKGTSLPFVMTNANRCRKEYLIILPPQWQSHLNLDFYKFAIIHVNNQN